MKRSPASGPDGGHQHRYDQRHAVRGDGREGVLDSGDDRRGQEDRRGEDHGERQCVRGGRRVVGFLHRTAAGDEVQVPWEGNPIVRVEHQHDDGGVECCD